MVSDSIDVAARYIRFFTTTTSPRMRRLVDQTGRCLQNITPCLHERCTTPRALLLNTYHLLLLVSFYLGYQSASFAWLLQHGPLYSYQPLTSPLG